MGLMGMPFWAGVFGAVVSLIFLVRAMIELKKDVPGHSRNAAMIHVAMVSMLAPFCIFVAIAYAP